MYIYICVLLLNYSVPSTYQYSVYIQNHPDAPRIMIEIVIFLVRNGKLQYYWHKLHRICWWNSRICKVKAMKLTIRKQFGSPYKQNPTQTTLPIFLLLASTPWYARFGTAARVAGSNEKHTQGHSHTHGLSTGFMRIRTKGFEHLISDRIEGNMTTSFLRKHVFHTWRGGFFEV